MDRKELAAQTFGAGFNCAQAVFSAFCDEVGIDRETALKIASGFGSGVRKGEVCGAASGAVMVLGLRYGYSENDGNVKKNMFSKAATFMDRFQETQGSYLCKEILQCDVSTEEGKRYALENHLFETTCRTAVDNAVEILEDLLK
ncbi:MAG: C-GCAxxG-C-C family protein [Clostridiales Family XIII bacterium]|jgi:C_GCAxxG_C_C family probable redox protein|nr:C-GCAxxG-C-C family protein [Clostridiales Family XIII bacterium]